MNMNFDRERLMANITALIQQKGMNIGDVEAAVGSSKGYISRLLKNESIPSSDFTWKLAKVLGVSTDMLIEGDSTGSLKGSEDLVYASQEWLSSKYIDDAEQWGVIDPERWDAFYGWLYENELTSHDLRTTGYTNDYLK